MKCGDVVLWLAWGGLLTGGSAAPVAAEEPQQVAFSAVDGFRIYADYYGPTSSYNDAAMVILLHMENAERAAWAPLIPPLREAGFVVLVPDLRGHGQSATSGTRERLGRRDPQLFRDMQSDVLGAYNWLAEQKGVDRARLAIVGAGAGAGVALSYAVADRSVDVLVCLSPELDQPGLDTRGDAGQLTGRRVLLLATEEGRTACEQLAARVAGAEKRVLDGSGRGTGLLGTGSGLEKDIVDFLIRGVGKPSQKVVYGSIRSNVYHPAQSGWIGEIDARNLRHYSSAEEAAARGLRPARSPGPREPRRGEGAGSRPSPPAP